MARAWTGGTASPSCGRTDAEKALVDKADARFHFPALKSGKPAWSHIFQLLPSAFGANDCTFFESGRLGEEGHEKLGGGRAAGEVVVDRNGSVHRMTPRKKTGDLATLPICQKDLPDVVAVAQRGDSSGYGAGADCCDLSSLRGSTAKVVKVFLVANPATYQQQVNLRNIVRRDHKRHIGEPVLTYPLIRVEKRDFTAGAAGKL
jgi:hypothetical protein